MSEDRIVIAVNKMILNQEVITDVIVGGHDSFKELFFQYNSKYIWSILENSSTGGYSLYFYPKTESVSQVSTLHDFRGVNMVHYSSSEIGTKEAHDSFKDLHSILLEKVYGIDDVLDDIINN